MYVPAHFAVDDLDEVARFVADVGAADFVTFDGARPVASLLPVIWDRPGDGGAGEGDAGSGDAARGEAARGEAAGESAGAGGYGRLLAHIALANPQWSSAAEGVPGLAIVHGPQAYISPSWYPGKKEHGRVVPTWNYVSVHFSGPVTFHRDEEWLREVVTLLTDRHEADREDRWRVDDAPAGYLSGQLRAIVGVEMTIERVEAKAKLSQNRPGQDQAAVIAALRGESGSGAHAIAGLMAGRAAATAEVAGWPGPAWP